MSAAPQRDVWATVEQPAPRPPGGTPVTLTLKPRLADSPVRLWLSVNAETAAALGWADGTKLGMAIGTAGRVEGWLRFAPDPSGIRLTMLGRKAMAGGGRSLTCSFLPGDPLAQWNGPRTAVEYRVLAGDHALLCEIPWSFDGAEAADDAAEAA